MLGPANSGAYFVQTEPGDCPIGLKICAVDGLIVGRYSAPSKKLLAFAPMEGHVPISFGLTPGLTTSGVEVTESMATGLDLDQTSSAVSIEPGCEWMFLQVPAELQRRVSLMVGGQKVVEGVSGINNTLLCDLMTLRGWSPLVSAFSKTPLALTARRSGLRSRWRRCWIPL